MKRVLQTKAWQREHEIAYTPPYGERVMREVSQGMIITVHENKAVEKRRSHGHYSRAEMDRPPYGSLS